MSDPLEGLPDTARRIVETTRRLLIEHGYGYLSIENIANECELNKAAIRYYFRNKAGLMELVVDSWVHDNFRYLEPLAVLTTEPVLSDRESLRAFMQAKMEMIRDREMYLAFFELLPATLRDTRNSRRIAELYEWAANMYAQLFASSLQGLTEQQVTGFSELLFAVVDGLGVQGVLSPEGFSPDAALELLTEILSVWAANRAET